MDELLGELNGVGEVDVVVVGAGGDQKFALELGSVGYRRRILVALGVVLRQAHVALGVDGVVLAPVCDRRAGEPGLEDLGRVQHRVASHVSAIAPAPDANARAVYVGQCLQIADAGELVGEFHLTHPMKQRGFKRVAPRGHSPVVHCEDQEALLRHHLVPEEVGASPGVAHHLAMWPAIEMHQRRVFLRGVKARRLDHHSLKRRPVGASHGEKLHGLERVRSEFRHLVLVDHRHTRAIGLREFLPRGSHGVGIGIDVMRRVGSHVDAVRAVFARHAAQRAIVQRDAVEMPLDRAFLGGGKVDGAALFVHSRQAGYLPGATSHLFEKLSAEVVEIEVAKAVALARP